MYHFSNPIQFFKLACYKINLTCYLAIIEFTMSYGYFNLSCPNALLAVSVDALPQKKEKKPPSGGKNKKKEKKESTLY